MTTGSAAWAWLTMAWQWQQGPGTASSRSGTRVWRWRLDSKVEWKTIPTSPCLNFIILHIQSFPNTIILTPDTPKTTKGKFSLSSFKRAQLSVTHIAPKRKKEKSIKEFRGFQMYGKDKSCIPPMTMASGIVVNPTLPCHHCCLHHSANTSCPHPPRRVS